MTDLSLHLTDVLYRAYIVGEECHFAILEIFPTLMKTPNFRMLLKKISLPCQLLPVYFQLSQNTHFTKEDY